MARFRLRRRLRLRIALVAVMALLWSQLVLAGHVDCLMLSAAAIPAEVATVDHGCEDQAPDQVPALDQASALEQAVCAAHCSHGDVSAENARIPPVPPMLAAPAIPLISIVLLAGATDSGGIPGVGLPPPVSWHRPTPHPAALLLI